MDALNKKRRNLKWNIQRTKDYLDKWSKPDVADYVARSEALLEELQSYKRQYEAVACESYAALDESKPEDRKKAEEELTKEQDEVRSIVILSTTKVKVLQKAAHEAFLSSTASVNDSVLSVRTEQAVKLPKITIPKFDGNIRKFMKFKGLFQNLIHDDESIPKIRKLYYLQEALSEGDAEPLVRDLAVSEVAYDIAWKLVLDKYDNKRKIVKSHLNDLFSIKPIKSECELGKLIDEVNSCLSGLKICGERTQNWSTILSYLVHSKLDETTRRDFENSVTDCSRFPPYETLSTFMESRANAADDRKPVKEMKPNVKQQPMLVPKKTSNNATTASAGSNERRCIAGCPENHLLIDCKVFSQKSPRERFQIVRTKGICRNCFGSKHHSSSCLKGGCKLCGSKHHTLLHFDALPKPAENPKDDCEPHTAESSLTKEKNAELKVCNSTTDLHCSGSKFVLLPTAVVHFKCGRVIGNARVLLDSASQATLVSDKFVNHFHLVTQKTSTPLSIDGVGPGSIVSDRICRIQLQSRFNQFAVDVECDVVPSLAFKYEVPVSTVKCLSDMIKDIKMAESTIVPDGQVDLIVGAEYVEQIYKQRTMKIDRVTLRESRFGWLSIGPVGRENPRYSTSNVVCVHQATTSQIESKLQLLWESEEFDHCPPKMLEHELCNKHFEENYSRAENGQFIVRLPLKGSVDSLADTRSMAERSLMKILSKPVEVCDEYHKFITEYADLNHLSFTKPEDDSSKINYVLPQLIVIRDDKTTTKLRVVFHASYRVYDRLSLNDILMTGPALQLDLFDTIIRFRRHAIAFAADVEKMYRQVLVDPRDRHLQKIYYRPRVNDELKLGVLNTVTYGTVTASFQATKCLSILANEISSTAPVAADVIKKDFYMDDLLTGQDNVKDAVNLCKSISSHLLSGNFPLRKFCSNSTEFLEHLDPLLIEKSECKDISNANVKVLGFRWFTKTDKLGIVLETNNLPTVITKRVMLSEIASVFDILGILSPVTIRAKLQLQKLWQIKLNWDEEIPSDERDTFSSYCNELVELQSFCFDRHYHLFSSNVSYELVGFCDASNLAYAAVVYVRIPIPNARPAVSFVCAKTRVAPARNKLTIPRLELQAACLLVRLLSKVSSILEHPPQRMLAFSDSTVALSWISKPSEYWKVFVANRVKEVSSLVPIENWGYVNTKLNPADLATRGISSRMFLSNDLWLKGPDFLYQDSVLATAKTSDFSTEDGDVLVEKRNSASCAAIVPKDLSFLNRFSSFKHVIIVLAYVLRFLRKEVHKGSVLSAAELKLAFDRFVFVTQKFHFPDGAQSKRLKSLCPFVDDVGLLRVGGRLRNARLSFEQKHPLVLPVESVFVKLYIRYLHLKFFHATKSFLCSFIKSKIWVTGGLLNAIKKVIRECVACCRFKGETYAQVMGNLPADRVNESDVFSRVGIDFAGPFRCKCVGHRSVKINKVYLAVYVCLSSRAVHLEVLSDLTTACFLDSFKRFSARKGLPSLVYSDNGRTFVGASNYLNLTCPTLQSFAGSEGIRWVFIPPFAPNQGGLWEAAVKSAKHHLRRVVGNQILTFEEYSTLFAQIESVLNSRPLCYVNVGDNSNVAVTPASLLIGRPLLSNVDADLSRSRSLGERYRLRQQLVSSFWTSWRNDYLNQLQMRVKWKNPSDNVKVRDVVLLRQPDLSPGSWPMGLVEAVYPDSSGHVRIVDVKTSGGVKRRTVRQLVKLLSEEDSISD